MRADRTRTKVRQRDAGFPDNIRSYLKVEQPARRPHVDCTTKGGYMNLEHAFPNQRSAWEGKDFDILK